MRPDGSSISAGSSRAPTRRRSSLAWRPCSDGEPFPDFFLNNAGVIGHSMITLDEGEYIAWTEPAEEGGDIITAPLTVGPGDDDAVIPATDSGSIRAGDYLFDADVSAGGTTVTFTNSSDNQFHHVVLIDFGTNDPAVVEEHLPAIAESEGEGPAARGPRHGPDDRFRRFWCVRAGFERHVRRNVRGRAHVRGHLLHHGP